ncbi:MAG: peptide deformylase [Clostridia bacterium]|nr:peptide deformylase [Clostridia bacterium]MBR2327820.1 peptide deformylase [Clostridia bacterium]
MALRNILTYEEDVLHKVCREVTEFDSKLATLLDDMHETLTESGGVGLAAPQIGILRRVVVAEYDDQYYELINPVIVEKKGSQRVVEGCLSCPGQNCVLTRPQKVTVKAKNRFGEDVKYLFSGFWAKLACHEIDHLDGVLIIDIKEKFYDPKTDKNLK